MGSKSKKTVSRHTTETETGTHAFEIVGYTLQKGIGVGKFIRSGTFIVGGSDWSIRFYPDGTEMNRQYVAICLELMGKNAEARASCRLSLVNQITGVLTCLLSESNTKVFRSSDRFAVALIQRSTVESKSAGYLVDDVLTIECSVTVVKESQISDITGGLEIEVPPSDLSEHFGKLFLEEESADITFIVEREKFHAHKIVLAARSPVFKAELYGHMKESMARHLTVEDISPNIFLGLLEFIYTDSMPDWGGLDVDDYCTAVQDLLVAADRYAMDRLKLLCASLLAEYLDVENAATTLALADQHNCDRLKDCCIEFMASSGDMEAVVASQGYANVKRTCPSILVDLLERTSKYRKT